MQATLSAPQDLSSRLSELTRPVNNLEEGILVSATYDGENRVAVLKFYDPKLERIWLWRDNTGHRPYCYTKLPLEQVREKVKGRSDIIAVTEEKKLDLLSDSTIMVRRIVATDPLAIGGSPGRSLRDEMECWEADIKYYENYTYDRGLRTGTYYNIVDSRLSPVEKEVPETVKRSLESMLSKTTGSAASHIKDWAELLGQPLTTFKRIACDIEVANEQNRIPDPEKADRKIIAVSFHNERESLVYLVQRGGDDSLADARRPYMPVVFPDEPSMLRATFAKMMDYPFLITFNGDDFDLRYLKHRAENLGVREEEIPIVLQRQEASLKHGVHIDLYRFFNNRSIQIYVYGNRYSEHTLNGISEALLDRSKIEFDGNIGELPMLELADYCLNDSQITYELTSANDSLLMKIILVISRIAKMPMNDVARLGVSNWIRSMLFYEHRRMGALIPRSEELRRKGGASSEAIIKGKKYKGGLVIEPKPGIHFGVSVLDFASLYPSIIKVHNLSYETVNCEHDECKRNRVPDTENWVCEKRDGIESLVTGSLRDLRVNHYKQLSKSQSLSKEDRDLNNTVSQGLKVILNACFTGDTDIVTPEAIKNIKDIVVGDRVINVNPETLKAEIDRVVEIQQFPYRGEMYHFNDRQFVDLQVTPNHRFLVKDVKAGSKSRAMFRTAQEVFNATNMAIPKLTGGVELSRSPGRISLLATAQKLGAVAKLYPRAGQRLSSWFARLPADQKQKIRGWGRVDKNRSELVAALRSHYRISASVLTEDDIDVVERTGGFVRLGMPRSSMVPARYDSAGFASLCGWFVSEGNLIANESKFYPAGSNRGTSSGILITQSYDKGGAIGGPYRSEIGELLSRLGLGHVTDSGDNEHFQVSNRLIHEWMRENCYVDGSNQDTSSKRIPRFVVSSLANMKSFLDSCYRGDRSGRNRMYSTSSIQLARGMVVVLSLLGAKSKIEYDQSEGIYRVVFKNARSKLTYSGPFRHRHVKKFEYEGMVYCVTTERNHTVVAGRNGRFVPVGQSYGVMGFETFALYCLPVAEATAAFGRDAITKTISLCQKLGIAVIYSDTDSIFLENPTSTQIKTVADWAEKELGVEMDLDKTYRYVAFSDRKKNYFGVLSDGTPDIKGLTGKKSMTPEFLKKTFYDSLEILGKVYGQQDFERAKASIRELLMKNFAMLRDRQVPLEDLSFNVMMGKSISGYGNRTKDERIAPSLTNQDRDSPVERSGFVDSTPQHVKAAIQLEKTGREIKAGDIISYVKTKNPPYVKPTALARPDEIDVDKYLDYGKSMFDQILDGLGFNFDEIMGGTTLDLFWS